MQDRGFNQVTLAEASKVSRDTIWRILHQKGNPGEDILNRLSAAVGQPLPALTDASQHRRSVTEGLADSEGEPEGPGFQWDRTDYTQLEEEDVLGMLLYQRPMFLRYLQRQFERPVPTPAAAKLGYLEFVEKIAKEKGVAVPSEYLETLRRLIREGGL